MRQLKDLSEASQPDGVHCALISMDGNEHFVVTAVRVVVRSVGNRASDDPTGVRVANDDDWDGSGWLVDRERICARGKHGVAPVDVVRQFKRTGEE